MSKFPDLFIALAEKGYNDFDLEKIAGMNLIRAFKEAEIVAKKLQKSKKPSDVLIPVNEFMIKVANNTYREGLLEDLPEK